MKQLFLLLLMFFLSVSSLFSQIQKGTVMVGGNAGFQFKANNEKRTEFMFSASPTALYSVIKQLALGGQLSYNYHLTKDKNPTARASAQNTFMIGPALRTNIFVGGKSYFFVHGSPMFGIDVERDPTDRDKTYYSSSIIAWRLGPGFSVFATKSMVVEFGLYYDGMKQVGAIKQRKAVLVKDAPVFTHGLTVAIGLQFYAHKKQEQLEPVNSGK